MKDFFATVYETWFQLYDSQFPLIFDTLFDASGYNKFGFLFILIPLFLWLLFYYAWKYPYGKLWHWLVWLIITVIVVSASTFSLASVAIFASENPSLIDAIADSESGYEDFANSLPLKYAFINAVLTIGIGFIYSLILKQFSKIQIHLPF